MQAIIEETTDLPMKAPLSQEMVQQVSRLANAYIENLGNKGKVRTISPLRLLPLFTLFKRFAYVRIVDVV